MLGVCELDRVTEAIGLAVVVEAFAVDHVHRVAHHHILGLDGCHQLLDGHAGMTFDVHVLGQLAQLLFGQLVQLLDVASLVDDAGQVAKLERLGFLPGSTSAFIPSATAASPRCQFGGIGGCHDFVQHQASQLVDRQRVMAINIDIRSEGAQLQLGERLQTGITTTEDDRIFGRLFLRLDQPIRLGLGFFLAANELTDALACSVLHAIAAARNVVGDERQHGLIFRHGALRRRPDRPPLSGGRSAGDGVLEEVAEVRCGDQLLDRLAHPYTLATAHTDIAIELRAGDAIAPLGGKPEGGAVLRVGQAVAIDERSMRAPGTYQVGSLSWASDVQASLTDINSLQLQEVGQVLHRHHAFIAQGAVERLDHLGMATQPGAGTTAEHADVRAHHNAVQRISDHRDRVAVRVAPLAGTTESGAVAGYIAGVVEHGAGSARFAIEQDQVGGVLNRLPQGIEVGRRVIDIGLRHRRIQGVILSAGGGLGGGELDTVWCRLTTDQSGWHGEAFAQVVLHVFEGLNAYAYTRQNIIRNHAAIAVGDGDCRQRGIDWKRCFAHVVPLMRIRPAEPARRERNRYRPAHRSPRRSR
nr:MAG TPA: hypothetical protein [Caudoviricetes sp.]